MAIEVVPAWELSLPPPIPLRRFNVAEYHRMIDAGVFAHDERFELLEGWIVSKAARTPSHEVAIELGAEILRGCLPAGWRVRVQSAITTPDSEPEPDLAVIRGAIRDHVDRHPEPAEVALVIEEADASLATDHTLKGRIYARAGIAAYWLVNLVDGRVEVYTGPTGPGANSGYSERRDHGPGEPISLSIDGAEVARIDPRELLP